jgi:intein/homing endonuclease/predicted lipid-binding transport protein (Tim44 family)
MKRLLLWAGLLLLLIPDPSWSRGGGGCLEEGTRVATPNGSITIERLAVGDRVWGIDRGQLKSVQVRSVIKVLPEKFLEISAGKTHLRVTPEHPLMTGPGEFRTADHLSAGDKIYLTGQGQLSATPIESVRVLQARHPAYNLLVSPSGTFIAEGVALHNKGCFLPDSPILMSDGSEKRISAVKPGDKLLAFKTDGHLVVTRTQSVIKHQVDDYVLVKTDRATIEVTEEHPFYVGQGRFKTVEALKAGDSILAYDGKWLEEQRILSMEKIHKRVTVFNLQTDQPNTFFAHGLAVHNKGGGCFPKGTPIATPQGLKAIETLVSGDEVLAVDEGGRTVSTRVRTIFINKSSLLEIETRAGRLVATADHPIALGQGRFRPAGELNSGEPILQWKKGRTLITPIGRVREGNEEALVFNLTVDAPHTFIAGGIVVHNKGGGCLPAGTPVSTLQGPEPIETLNPGTRVLTIDPQGKPLSVSVVKLFQTRALVLSVTTDAGTLRSTADHPIGCPGGAFVAAGQLRAGQKVLVRKADVLQSATVLKIEWEERETPVYNLSVEAPHTFLAAGFLTHNKGGGGGSSGSHSSSSSSPGGSGESSSFIDTLVSLFFFLIFFTLFILIFIRIIYVARKKKREENLDFVYSRSQIAPKADKTEKLLAFISQQDPLVIPENLRQQAEATFLKLQECWSSRVYDPMKPLLMPDLYGQHLAQLQGLARNHEFNRIDNLKIEKIDLVNIRYTEKLGQREFTALITATARDYYVEDQTEKFLRGDSTPARFQEFWTFHLMDGQWLLREIEQAGESEMLKADNFAEMLTDETLKGIYGKAASAQGQAGPWLEKEVETKATRIERMLNFLVQTDKLWDRNQMLERSRKVFLDVYLARENGDPGQVPGDDLFPPVAEDLRAQMQSWKDQGYAVEYRNLCVRKVELVLVHNYADNSRDEYMTRITAHAQRIIRQGETIRNAQDYVTAFEEYWTFGRLDGQWKLKEILPPGQGEKEIAQENLDEDSTPQQMKWYYDQNRAK